MKVGIFHPPLNVCGGAEWVAVNIISSLKKEGHQIIVLTNEEIDQDKQKRIFGNPVNADKEIVLPLELFPVTDLHNIYTDGLRTLFLKSKCDLVIDTQSNGILPGANITYIHFPIFGRLENSNTSKARAAYFLPYSFYERGQAKNTKRLVFSNSKYTADAIRKFTGINPSLLYPPISKAFYEDFDLFCKRENFVVSVSRISPEKRLTQVSEIARLTNEKIHFLIVGMNHSNYELNRILESIERNQVSDRVEVITDVSRKRLQTILRMSKIFLHQTHGEHFGVSIVEAMASGCIPVVHDSGGPKEFVPEQLRFKNLDEAARKIDTAFSEWTPQKSKEINTLAQSFNEENFSKRFLEMFNSYVRNSSKE